MRIPLTMTSWRRFCCWVSTVSLLLLLQVLTDTGNGKHIHITIYCTFQTCFVSIKKLFHFLITLSHTNKVNNFFIVFRKLRDIYTIYIPFIYLKTVSPYVIVDIYER